MKKQYFLITILLLPLIMRVNAQTTVTDYDGNVYNTVNIGNQTWLKENLKSMHYSDGLSIPNVVAYNNDEGLAAIYGRLYTWNAAVRDSVTNQVQGVCPCGWHVASNTEWTELITYLGGVNVAGGKMKEAGTAHWQSPNTGADNSSGFTALGSGEYDAHEFMIFQLLHQYEVYWTSTQVSADKAKEKYLSYNDAKCSNYDWYKVMKYSVRCIKNQSSGISLSSNKLKIKIINPIIGDKLQFINESNIDIKSVEIYNMEGQSLKKEVLTNTPSYVDLQGLRSGIYLLKIISVNECIVIKFYKPE